MKKLKPHHKFFISAAICFVLSILTLSTPFLPFIFIIPAIGLFFAGAFSEGKSKRSQSENTWQKPTLQTDICSRCQKLFSVEGLKTSGGKKYCEKCLPQARKEMAEQRRLTQAASGGVYKRKQKKFQKMQSNAASNIQADKNKEIRIRTILKESKFVRPDPGPAYPGSYDQGQSYKQYVEGRELLFHLGHISEEDDWSHDYIYLDRNTERPWYIVDQYNGGIYAFSIYGGKEISMELFQKLAVAANETKYLTIFEPKKTPTKQSQAIPGEPVGTLEMWKAWQFSLPKIFEVKGTEYIELEFLKEVIDVAPDNYSGTDNVYYFKDGKAFMRVSHWDGGNMFANRSGDPELLSRDKFVDVLNRQKQKILKKLSEQVKSEFEAVFQDVVDILVSQLDSDRDHRAAKRTYATLFQVNYTDDGVSQSGKIQLYRDGKKLLHCVLTDESYDIYYDEVTIPSGMIHDGKIYLKILWKYIENNITRLNDAPAPTDCNLEERFDILTALRERPAHIYLFDKPSRSDDRDYRVSYTGYYLDRYTGKAYSHTTSSVPFGSIDTASVYEQEIDYAFLLTIAKRYDEEVYRKLEGINESNWMEYIKELES